MARGRIISKTISHSTKIAKVLSRSEFAALLYTWIIPHTDDFGQISADITGIMLMVMPASKRKQADFTGAIKLLIEHGLLQKNGHVIRVIGFDNFQSFRSDRNKQNKYPGIEWNDSDIPVPYQDIPLADVSEVKLREVKRSKEKINYNYVTNKFENITKEQIKRFETAYPAIDIEGQILRAGVWLESNPKNKKSDFKSFLNKWFVKAQDRAPRSTGAKPKNDPFEDI